jgi:hypothetical protein
MVSAGAALFWPKRAGSASKHRLQQQQLMQVQAQEAERDAELASSRVQVQELQQQLRGAAGSSRVGGSRW